MQRSAARIACKVCGRPYSPGERIEIVEQTGHASIVHIECMDDVARQLLSRPVYCPDYENLPQQSGTEFADAFEG